MLLSKNLAYLLASVQKRLAKGMFSKGGRNFLGRICIFHRGDGNRRRFRLIDYKRCVNGFGYICKIIYDPNRTSYLGFVFYDNGLFSYILLADKLKFGNKVYSGSFLNDSSAYSLGSSLSLKYFNLFEVVSCVEPKRGKGAIFSRAAGTGAILISKTEKKVTLKLKSGWLLVVRPECTATVGYVSNFMYNMVNICKAGKNRGQVYVLQ